MTGFHLLFNWLLGAPVVDCRGPTGPVRVVTTRETESRYKCVFYPPVAGISLYFILKIFLGNIYECYCRFIIGTRVIVNIIVALIKIMSENDQNMKSF